MSAELLINNDKSTKNIISNTKTTSSNNEKKEGLSLFDSLVNKAKEDTVLDDKNNLKDQKNDENKPVVIEKDKTINLSKQTSESKENINKPVEKANTIIPSKTESSSVDKSSLKVMIEKLVDIIVSTAEKVPKKNDSNDSTNTQVVKNKINQILADKITNNTSMNELGTEVKKMLDGTDLSQLKKDLITSEISKVSKIEITDKTSIDEIVTSIKGKVNTIKESVNSIKNNVENIKTDKIENPENLENSKIKNDKKASDTLLKTSNLATNKENIVKNANVIKVETEEIKNDINEIHKKVESEVDKEESSSKKLQKDSINSKLISIENSADDIVIEIDKIKPSNSKNITKKEDAESLKKIDLKIETITTNINELEVEVSEKIIVKTSFTIDDEILADTRLEDDKSVLNMLVKDTSSKEAKNPLLASMFLNAQKNDKEKTSLSQIKDAKQNITEKKSIEAVKQSANSLELEIEETEVTHEGDETKKIVPDIKKDDKKVNTLLDNRDLNKMLINQKVATKTLQNERTEVLNTQKISSESNEKEKQVIETVEISVAKDAVQGLQNKIIGAQQKMGSFMSEVARNMYLNYKPPVTAFRVNLNPANLGSISIIMRSNKVDNTLSVSMNLSNSNTMEAFTENKSMLHNAIQRQFNDGSNVSLNFGMQDQNSENNFNKQFNQDSGSKNNNRHDNENMDEDNIEEQEVIENNDYM